MKDRISNPIVKSLVEWIIAIGLALLLFLVLRMFVFRVAHVSGVSMAPTLSHDDRVILNRAAIVFGEPRAGDIVAFPYPGNLDEYHIKRVIGVPGDVIDFAGGRFYVNGEPLSDPFSYEAVWSVGNVDFPVTVEEGRVFLLGDNRNVSRDSRCVTVGNVHESEMLGKVFIRFWPFSSFGRVD